MYLILFGCVVLFIGIVSLVKRISKNAKDPLSFWRIVSDGSETKDHGSIVPDIDHEDILFDPAYQALKGNIYHDNFRED